MYPSQITDIYQVTERTQKFLELQVKRRNEFIREKIAKMSSVQSFLKLITPNDGYKDYLRDFTYQVKLKDELQNEAIDALIANNGFDQTKLIIEEDTIFSPLGAMCSYIECNQYALKRILAQPGIDVNKILEVNSNTVSQYNDYRVNTDTPLILACKARNYEAVKLLLRHPKIDVNKKNKDDLDPLSVILLQRDWHINISSSDNFDLKAPHEFENVNNNLGNYMMDYMPKDCRFGGYMHTAREHGGDTLYYIEHNDETSDQPNSQGSDIEQDEYEFWKTMYRIEESVLILRMLIADPRTKFNFDLQENDADNQYHPLNVFLMHLKNKNYPVIKVFFAYFCLRANEKVYTPKMMYKVALQFLEEVLQNSGIMNMDDFNQAWDKISSAIQNDMQEEIDLMRQAVYSNIDFAVADTYILMRSFADEYVKIKPETPADNNTARFLNIAKSLPLDLLHVLAYRQYGSAKNNIPAKTREEAEKDEFQYHRRFSYK